MTAPRTKMNECHRCVHRRSVPGNCHIKCANPDPEMTGSAHGMRNGWFYYPMLFDPVWKNADCNNYEEVPTPPIEEEPQP